MTLRMLLPHPLFYAPQRLGTGRGLLGKVHVYVWGCERQRKLDGNAQLQRLQPFAQSQAAALATSAAGQRRALSQPCDTRQRQLRAEWPRACCRQRFGRWLQAPLQWLVPSSLSDSRSSQAVCTCAWYFSHEQGNRFAHRMNLLPLCPRSLAALSTHLSCCPQGPAAPPSGACTFFLLYTMYLLSGKCAYLQHAWGWDGSRGPTAATR